MTRPLTTLALLLAICLVSPRSQAASAPASAPNPPPNSLTLTGKLTTGIMAVGGETTGTILSDGKSTYELDLQDPALKRKASDLNGKQVTVQGTLTLKAGIEVAQRRIITVTALDAAPPAAPPATLPTAPATRPATAPASGPAR